MAQSVKKKESGLKTFGVTVGIIVGILLIIILAAIIVINIMVMPKNDTSDKAVFVGGMLTSDTVEYKSEASKGMEKSLVTKIMQIVWKSCDASDKKVHAAQTPPTNIVKIKDMPYVDDANPYHQLDVFYPEGKIQKEGLPVIIDIHGGGWMYATKDLNEYYCLELARRGYIVFSISYRLAPDVTVPEQIQDCMLALSWIGSHLNDYPANPESIMLTGDSAGGQLAAYCTVLTKSPDMRAVFSTVKTKLDISCLVLTSPVPYMKDGGIFSVYTKSLWGKDYKDSDYYKYMDIEEILDFTQEMPPTYFITSSGDTLAHDQTVRTYNLFMERGYTCEINDFGEIDGEALPHVFSVLDPFGTAGAQAIDGALDFYQRTLLRE